MISKALDCDPGRDEIEFLAQAAERFSAPIEEQPGDCGAIAERSMYRARPGCSCHSSAYYKQPRLVECSGHRAAGGKTASCGNGRYRESGESS